MDGESYRLPHKLLGTWIFGGKQRSGGQRKTLRKSYLDLLRNLQFDSNDSALCGSKGTLRNILKLFCKPVEFNLRLDHGLSEDVREWLTGPVNVLMIDIQSRSEYSANMQLGLKSLENKLPNKQQTNKDIHSRISPSNGYKSIYITHQQQCTCTARYIITAFVQFFQTQPTHYHIHAAKASAMLLCVCVCFVD